MIKVVGIGPGAREHMTYAAVEAIKSCDVVVGYKTYIDLIKEFIEEQEVIVNGMRGEVERCKEAVTQSLKGKTVCVISSGDAGVYGMAGLIYELVPESHAVEVIPGVTASTAGAAILGAPLMHDFCHISLSDLMTPLETIYNRVKAAAASDFVICLYNPKSHGRPDYINEALSMIMNYQGTNLWVGLAKDVGREGERTIISKIDEVDYDLIDMTTVVIVGNSNTRNIGGKMITPRGYTL
jgi:precorrin-3B C17-methyltransferase